MEDFFNGNAIQCTKIESLAEAFKWIKALFIIVLMILLLFLVATMSFYCEKCYACLMWTDINWRARVYLCQCKRDVYLINNYYFESECAKIKIQS